MFFWVLLTVVRGEGIAPEIALTKSVITNIRTRKHILSLIFKDVSREFDEFQVNTHLCNICLVGFLHSPLTVSVTESSDSSG